MVDFPMGVVDSMDLLVDFPLVEEEEDSMVDLLVDFPLVVVDFPMVDHLVDMVDLVVDFPMEVMVDLLGDFPLVGAVSMEVEEVIFFYLQYCSVRVVAHPQ